MSWRAIGQAIVHCRDESHFSRRQQLGKGLWVIAEGGTDRQRDVELKAENPVTIGREPELAGTACDDIPGLPAGVSNRLMLSIRAQLAIEAGFTP
ncbi:MAG: hypothetical protein H6905_02575 [Hyphomicrobiales bacterium]|nr:hypothetical protein [Hyphomicrobiales bacterium]